MTTESKQMHIARINHWPLPRDLSLSQLRALQPMFNRIRQMTNDNEHTDAAALIATMFGHSDSIKVFTALQMLRQVKGHNDAYMVDLYNSQRYKLRDHVKKHYPEAYDEVHYAL